MMQKGLEKVNTRDDVNVAGLETDNREGIEKEKLNNLWVTEARKATPKFFSR